MSQCEPPLAGASLRSRAAAIHACATCAASCQLLVRVLVSTLEGQLPQHRTRCRVMVPRRHSTRRRCCRGPDMRSSPATRWQSSDALCCEGSWRAPQLHDIGGATSLLAFSTPRETWPCRALCCAPKQSRMELSNENFRPRRKGRRLIEKIAKI